MAPIQAASGTCPSSEQLPPTRTSRKTPKTAAVFTAPARISMARAAPGRSDVQTWNASAATAADASAQTTRLSFRPSGPCAPNSITTAGRKTSAAAARAAALQRATALRGRRCGLLDRSLALVPLDELLGQLVRLVVLDLLRGRLHEVRARRDERAGDALVQCELREPDGVDDDAGRVRRVPHLELQLDVQRHVAERRALHADVGPLAIGQPRHVVGRSHVHVLLTEVVVEHRRYGVRLRDLLRLEALALEHVEEVRVAADVQLHRLVEMHAALAEERGQDAVRDRRAHLRLDVVADDRHAGLLEAPLPVRLAREEDGHAVDHRAAGFENLLG